MQEQDTQLIGPEPVRERIGLQYRAFRDLHREGLPNYRINGRVIRYRWSEVEAWLQARRRGHADLFSSRYIGSVSELRVANHLRSWGWRIFFPGGSHGSADMLAIDRDGSMLAISARPLSST